MDKGCYLAMTGEEFFTSRDISGKSCWMGCTFSDTPGGLEGIPGYLPPGWILAIDDRNTPAAHRTEEIINAIEEIVHNRSPVALLLDFQKPGIAENEQLAGALSRKLKIPVAISEPYAAHTDGPVFITMPPPYRKIKDSIIPWAGREIWLELATESLLARITENGCTFSAADYPLTDLRQFCPDRYCRYTAEFEKDCAKIIFRRNIPELLLIQKDTEKLGIACTIGLYSQLGKYAKSADG